MDIAVTQVCDIIFQARAVQGKVAPPEQEGSNATDDAERAALVEGDSMRTLLAGTIASLNDDEKCELVALVWLGRGDYEASEWDEAIAEARDRGATHAARCLLGTPLLADFLAEGLASLGESCLPDEVSEI